MRDDPAHPFSEAIGVVASVEGEGGDAVVTVLSRRGEPRSFVAGDVIATKDM